MYDVIVVGARVAGASTAMLLARAGWPVVMSAIFLKSTRRDERSADE